MRQRVDFFAPRSIASFITLGCCLTLVSVSLAGCGGEIPQTPQTEEQQSEAVRAPTPGLNPDFDIRFFGIVDHIPFLTVAGIAGRTRVPVGSTDIYAYVFETDTGIFAVTSHFGVDSGDQSGPNDNSYHVHKVTLDANNCVTSLVDAGPPFLFFRVVAPLNTKARSVSAVLTARLSHTASGGVCVTEVFDHQP